MVLWLLSNKEYSFPRRLKFVLDLFSFALMFPVSFLDVISYSDQHFGLSIILQKTTGLSVHWPTFLFCFPFKMSTMFIIRPWRVIAPLQLMIF